MIKKVERYIYIVIIVILVGILASGATYMIMKSKEDNKENNNNVADKDTANKGSEINNKEEKNEVPKYDLSYFESYLKPFKNLGNVTFNNNSAYAYFIHNYYLRYLKNTEEYKEPICDYSNPSNQYGCKLALSKKLVHDTLNKYFDVTDIDLSNIKIEDYAYIESFGDNYVLNIKPTDFADFKKTIESLEYDDNKVNVKYKMQHCDGELKEKCFDEGSKIIELEYKNGKFVVNSIKWYD